jgi:hypothetical protein
MSWGYAVSRPYASRFERGGKTKTFERGESGERDRVIPPQHAKAARAGGPGDRGNRVIGKPGRRETDHRKIGSSGFQVVGKRKASALIRRTQFADSVRRLIKSQVPFSALHLLCRTLL